MTDTVQTHKPQKANFTFTEAALQHLTKEVEKKKNCIGLRISIKTTGCSGYAYQLDYVEAPIETDHVLHPTENITIYVEVKHLPLINNSTVDYIQSGLNKKLVFDNPNQKGVCGCGESFNI